MRKLIVLLMMLNAVLFANTEGFPYKEFEKARAGDEKATLQAIKKIEKLGSSDVNKAYLGSLTTMKARYTYLPWKKIEYVKKGSKLLDSAVKNSPKNIQVRLNRIFTYINFPSMLRKDNLIQEDVKTLMKIYKEKKLAKKYEEEVYKAFVMFFHKYKYAKEKEEFLGKIQSQKIQAQLNRWFEK